MTDRLAPAALRDSIARKARESAATIERCLTEQADAIAAAATAMARAFDAGGRLFALGNGGSACDAMHVAVEFMHPILERRPALPAMALPADTALMSAIGNDQDFALAWAQPLRVHGRRGDIALALSTSGHSANVHRALAVARELGMLTIGLSGKDGGRLPSVCDHCFVVPSFAIHRIQEAHVALLHVLWDAVHIARGEEDVTG